MDKYNTLRSSIKTGDVILYRGTSTLAKIIQWADKSYYNHAGIAYWIGDRLFTIDAWDNGTEIVPMSRRIDYYEDFCIIRPLNVPIINMRTGINNLLNRVEKNETYGWWGLIRRLLWLKAKINITWINKKRKPVCSDIARDFLVDIKKEHYATLFLPSPEDLLRFVTSEEEVLFNNSNILKNKP